MNKPPRIVCLSNVYDEHYHELRGEAIARRLASPKQRDLFRCLEIATGLEVVLLSSPPKALERREGKWIGATETLFSTHRQLFSSNYDAPKIRIPASWLFYAIQVLREVRDGDFVLINNYEFIYIVAARILALKRKVKFLLEFEDGKHLIDRGIYRVLSGTAEFLGKGLMSAAILVHPGLGQRLPAHVPTLLCPGFIIPPNTPKERRDPDCLHFLYSGSLDRTRGVDLLLQAVAFLPATGWHLHITGSGDLDIEGALREHPRASAVTFHGSLATVPYQELIRNCDVGLNCQRESDLISSVTFPSKIFSYLSADLLVLSSRASSVPEICGAACHYFDQETPESLAKGMTFMMENYSSLIAEPPAKAIKEAYSIEGTAKRLRELFLEAKFL